MRREQSDGNFFVFQILCLDKIERDLLCTRLNRIFDFVLDTSPWAKANKFAFVFGLFVSLTSS